MDSVNEWLLPQVGKSVAAATLWYTYYNFCRIHKSLRVTPGMAEITDHVWKLSELLS